MSRVMSDPFVYHSEPKRTSLLGWINRGLMAGLAGLFLFVMVHALGYIDTLGHSEQSFTWHEITGLLNLALLVFFLSFPRAYRHFLSGEK